MGAGCGLLSGQEVRAEASFLAFSVFSPAQVVKLEFPTSLVTCCNDSKTAPETPKGPGASLLLDPERSQAP